MCMILVVRARNYKSIHIWRPIRNLTIHNSWKNETERQREREKNIKTTIFNFQNNMLFSFNCWHSKRYTLCVCVYTVCDVKFHTTLNCRNIRGEITCQVEWFKYTQTSAYLIIYASVCFCIINFAREKPRLNWNS